MKNGRIPLPAGAKISLADGTVFEITGSPIGQGGGSILYPVRKLGDPVPIACVLKECYPCSGAWAVVRSDRGEILPLEEAGERCIQQAKAGMLREGTISREIYRSASRSLPVRHSAEEITLTLPGRAPQTVGNAVSIMDSLTGKGRSLSQWMESRGRFAPVEVFRILQQVLLAVKEVHEAGYLHLDIQDGNVFLRGSISGGDELVTLIDFGCARSMPGGKTAPITDGLIFTTQGFSAPEILLHNDGTLQLGPEADLFSVGCLALYLLTGQRTSVPEIIANRTGIYLRPNHLRRMKIPRHMVDALQQLLGKALAKEPENRYHTAEEMLQDVSGLAEALRPYRTDLQSVKYDAFICYRHGTVDSAAAVALQRGLEAYRAPKGLAGKRKPFGRVFLDEGELSSCADFGQQIREALKNAGWLIVICSSRAPASPWVQQEIDTFLQYHDRSRILAVLIDGTPETAFPPQLLGDGAGAGEVFAPHAMCETPREAARKLRGDTLLKIAAPMLATTYDTLKQRHRLYRLKRLAAMATAGLMLVSAFAAYALNRAHVIAGQNIRIQQEYTNALKNESQFLVEQTRNRLDYQDTAGALELLLQALPSPGQDRPVLPEAQDLLARALGVYTTPGSNHNALSASGIIETDKEHFTLDDTGDCLLAWSTTEGGVEVWDTEKLSLLRELCPEGAGGCTLIGIFGHNLILRHNAQLICQNYLTGGEGWRTETTPDLSAICPVGDDSLYAFSVSEQDAGTAISLDVLSVADGDIRKTQTFLLPDVIQQIGIVAVSEDARWAAFSAEALDATECGTLYLLDLDRTQGYRLTDADSCVAALTFTTDRLAVIREDGFLLTTMEEKLVSSAAIETDVFLELYDLETQTLLNSHTFSTFPAEYGAGSVTQVMYRRNGEERMGLVFLVENRAILLNQKDGSLVQEYTFPSGVVEISYLENGFEAITSDGTLCVANYESEFGKDSMVTRKCWSRTVTDACCHNQVSYIRHNAVGIREYSAIHKYQSGQSSPGYRTLACLESADEAVYAILKDQVILVGHNEIIVVDMDGNRKAFALPNDVTFDEIPMGMSAAEDRIYLSAHGRGETSGKRFYGLDQHTGEVRAYPFPEVEKSGYLSNQVFFEGSLYYTEKCQDGSTWVRAWDMESQQIRTLNSQPPETGILPGSLAVDGNRRLFYLSEREQQTELVWISLTDTGTGHIPIPQGQDITTTWSPSGALLCVALGKQCALMTPEGIPVDTIDLNTPVADIRFLGEEDLLIIGEDSTLTRWQKGITGGKQLDLQVYQALSLFPQQAKGWRLMFVEESNALLITNNQAFLLALADGDLKVEAVIEHCIGFDSRGNRFLTADTEYPPHQIGTIPRYTIQELILLGNQALGRKEG